MTSDIVESKVRSTDGTSLAYDLRGDGPPLVLVGGAFQYRAFDPRTAELADLLAQRFTVLVYDRRGRGESGEQLPYAREREVEDLAALVREAGGNASVFGMSSGGAGARRRSGRRRHCAAGSLRTPLCCRRHTAAAA